MAVEGCLLGERLTLKCSIIQEEGWVKLGQIRFEINRAFEGGAPLVLWGKGQR